MNPDYTDAERRAYAIGRADSVRAFQQSMQPLLAEAAARALEEAADAAVRDDDECIPWAHDSDRATVSAWLTERAAAYRATEPTEEVDQ